MKKALWFSRHAPTAAQVAEIAAMGYEIAALEDGLRLGAMNLADDGDVNAVLSALLALAAQHGADACFGVFAAPVQECLQRTANDAVQDGEWGRVLTCYAAWNVQRSVDGGKPTFEHRRWCCVGALSKEASFCMLLACDLSQCLEQYEPNCHLIGEVERALRKRTPNQKHETEAAPGRR